MAIHWTNSESLLMVSLSGGREGLMLTVFFYLVVDIS